MQTPVSTSMVATSQPDAVAVGLGILERGGTEVDAAIATAIALTVVEPCSNGIGSDAFAMVWMDGSSTESTPGRSPAAWPADVYHDRERMPILGWDAVIVQRSLRLDACTNDLAAWNCPPSPRGRFVSPATASS